jgi:hypothetical protein
MELKMRMMAITFILAMFVGNGPAAAQSWQQYSYPSDSFAVSFPAAPKIEIKTYQAADGRVVDARVYSVAQDDGEFKMTIADLSNAASGAAPEESAVIGHAVKTLSQGGEIKVDIPARINRVFGRQLSIVGADGSHSSGAVFYYNN